jgi:hypothetical protein
MKKFMLIFLCLFMAVPVLMAENDDTAVRAASDLGYDTETEGYFAISKVWPADESKTIIALAFPGAEQADENSTTYDLDVLVIDTKTGKTTARNTNKKAISSDALTFTGLTIDTAPYILAKGTRAFGVRMSYEGSSSANPASMGVMRLFVNCAGEFTDIIRTIGVKKTSTKGYRDLEVLAAESTRVSVKKGNDCAESTTEKPPAKPVILKYDGKKYKVPKELVFE